jgi:hypothetical protein
LSRIADSRNSPDYITAKTPQELRRLLLLNQETLGGQVNYISISFDGKEWVAWFFNDLSSMELTEAIRRTKR